MTIPEIPKRSSAAGVAPTVALVCCFGAFLALTLTGLTSVHPASEARESGHGMISSLSEVDEQIRVISTSIDNGDIDGMYSTAGASVELLIDRRKEILR